jgi:hypothetical protein
MGVRVPPSAPPQSLSFKFKPHRDALSIHITFFDVDYRFHREECHKQHYERSQITIERENSHQCEDGVQGQGDGKAYIDVFHFFVHLVKVSPCPDLGVLCASPVRF